MQFLKKAALSVLHLICLTVAVYTRAGDYPYLAIYPAVTANTVV